MERSIVESKNMDSERQTSANKHPVQQISLQRSGKKLNFERRLRFLFWLFGLPGLVLIWWLLWIHSVDTIETMILLVLYVLAWAFLVSILQEQITRPLQTLTNVVAALREDDYSFRARGARNNDAIGDLAQEINALADMLQIQRAGTLEAIALVERVVDSMQSPVLAFDPEGRLKLLNIAAERIFVMKAREALGHTARELGLERMAAATDDELLTMESGSQSGRWIVKRTGFRLRGVPHTLLVLADVSAALREEERIAWKRLIRVLGHEINNSLTPIKSIAANLRGQLERNSLGELEDFDRGLEVIENRAESLNRFLQAYRRLMGLPAPKLAPVELGELVRRVVKLETRLEVMVRGGKELIIQADADQLQQALINLVRNGVEAALGPEMEHADSAEVIVDWKESRNEVIITIIDNGPGVSNDSNLFVPFYTTKLEGTGIGLVLAQQIAEGHAGQVTLANRDDEESGCIAEIRLPLHPKL